MMEAAIVFATLWAVVVPPPGVLPAPGAAPQDAPDAAPVYSPPAPPPAPLPPRPRRYGDQGTSEVAIGLGYSSNSGLLAAGGYRFFVFDGVAPGIEATYVGGGNLTSKVGLVMGALRLVPVRTGNFALVLTGRAGRVMLSDHVDGWAAGGGGGVIIFFGDSHSVGLELGYEWLRLLPADFCADLTRCVLHGPVLGLRISF
ncbi:MAG: hypothetical protein H7X95_05415 [Deltaproteobacteria bacterium]|nr:hypothetical protein [Deltaproteobacteria bacterium]